MPFNAQTVSQHKVGTNLKTLEQKTNVFQSLQRQYAVTLCNCLS